MRLHLILNIENIQISKQWHQYQTNIYLFYCAYFVCLIFKTRMELRRWHCLYLKWIPYEHDRPNDRTDGQMDSERHNDMSFTTHSLRVYWFLCHTRQPRRLRWPTTTFTRTYSYLLNAIVYNAINNNTRTAVCVRACVSKRSFYGIHSNVTTHIVFTWTMWAVNYIYIIYWKLKPFKICRKSI